MKAQGKASERGELAAALGRRHQQPLSPERAKCRRGQRDGEHFALSGLDGQNETWSQGSALGYHIPAFQASKASSRVAKRNLECLSQLCDHSLAQRA